MVKRSRGRPRESLIGQKFGKLTVVDKAPDKNNRSAWYCKCDCGNPELVYVQSNRLKCGDTKSCDCAIRDSKLGEKNYNKKYNTYEFYGDYVIGWDNSGNYFYFDFENYEEVSKYYWLKDSYGYFSTSINNGHGDITRLLLHRFITNCPKGMVVDHINRKRNDCRRSNLRICTHRQNMQNTDKRGKEFYAPVIKVFRLQGFEELGEFETSEEAINAYQEYIKKQ